MRPSHRKRNYDWCPGPKSAWARGRRNSAYAMSFPEELRAQVIAFCNETDDNYVRMTGWPPRRQEPGRIFVLSSPTASAQRQSVDPK